MNSRELGLVSSAFNSLLGTMGAQSSQQMDSTKSFNTVLDNKMNYAEKKTLMKTKSSETQQVNREKMSAKDSEYENDREAFVKSDMQKPKKAIAKAAKEPREVSKDEKVDVSKETKKTDKVEKLENVEETQEIEAVEEVEVVKENDVLEALMALLSNDQMTETEKISGMNEILSDLSTEDLSSLQGMMKDLKNLLMSVNGSLKDFEETLAKLPALDSDFSSLLENLEAENLSLSQLVEDTKDLVGLTEEAVVTEDTGSENLIKENETPITEKTVAEEVLKNTPKETKAEQLKEAAQVKAESVTVVAETGASANTSSNNQSNQQQSTTEGNQSFVEALKFHNAEVKTVAMKGAMASNPFEEKIMQQIIKGTQVSLNVGKDVSEMMIKLNPKDLGNVSLKISLENEQLVAKFNVENQTVKEVLESRLDDLRTALSDKGFTIEGLDVSVDQDANEQFRSYEEFIKQQKSKRSFKDLDEIEGIAALGNVEDTSTKWQTLETTSSEINVLA